MMNFKQEELIDTLMTEIRRKFPEVRLIRVTESPEDPDSLWLNITWPEDEDREIELIDFAGDKVADILMDYGYHISLMPVGKQAA